MKKRKKITAKTRNRPPEIKVRRLQPLPKGILFKDHKPLRYYYREDGTVWIVVVGKDRGRYLRPLSRREREEEAKWAAEKERKFRIEREREEAEEEYRRAAQEEKELAKEERKRGRTRERERAWEDDMEAALSDLLL